MIRYDTISSGKVVFAKGTHKMAVVESPWRFHIHPASHCAHTPSGFSFLLSSFPTPAVAVIAASDRTYGFLHVVSCRADWQAERYPLG